MPEPKTDKADKPEKPEKPEKTDKKRKVYSEHEKRIINGSMMFSPSELFQQVREDTRSIIDQNNAILEHVNGFERRLMDQNKQLTDLIHSLDKRVVVLEATTAQKGQVQESARKLTINSIVLIILTLALITNVVITYVRPPVVVVPQGMFQSKQQ